MSSRRALASAVDLLRRPDLARCMRTAALPNDVELVMRVAADEKIDPADQPRISRAALREAAEFYLQQVLLHPENDPYRVLGGSSETPIEVLRRHRTLMLKWLHPDVRHDAWEAVFAARVNAAWAYVSSAAKGDGQPPSRQVPPPLRNGAIQGPLPWIARPIAQANARATKSMRTMTLVTLAGAVAAASAICLPSMHIPSRICTSFGWECWPADGSHGEDPGQASVWPDISGPTDSTAAKPVRWRSTLSP